MPYKSMLSPTDLTFVPIQGALLGDVLARRVPVSAFCRYRVSLQRKKRCQQIIGFNDESFSIAVCWAYRSHGILGTVLIIILILYLLGRL